MYCIWMLDNIWIWCNRQAYGPGVTFIEDFCFRFVRNIAYL